MDPEEFDSWYKYQQEGEEDATASMGKFFNNLGSDCSIVCLDRVKPKVKIPQVRFVQGDFGDRAVLERLSRGVGQIDVCVHLAAVTASNNLPPEAQGEEERGDIQMAVNVTGTHTLLTHLRDKGTCVSSPDPLSVCRRL